MHKQAVQSDHSLEPSSPTNPPHASALPHSQNPPRARAPSPTYVLCTWCIAEDPGVVHGIEGVAIGRSAGGIGCGCPWGRGVS